MNMKLLLLTFFLSVLTLPADAEQHQWWIFSTVRSQCVPSLSNISPYEAAAESYCELENVNKSAGLYMVQCYATPGHLKENRFLIFAETLQQCMNAKKLWEAGSPK